MLVKGCRQPFFPYEGYRRSLADPMCFQLPMHTHRPCRCYFSLTERLLEILLVPFVVDAFEEGLRVGEGAAFLPLSFCARLSSLRRYSQPHHKACSKYICNPSPVCLVAFQSISPSMRYLSPVSVTCVIITSLVLVVKILRPRCPFTLAQLRLWQDHVLGGGTFHGEKT